jgi:hypothetical protein
MSDPNVDYAIGEKVGVVAGEMKVVARIMTAIGDLQTADTNLTTVVAQVISDWATALTNALANNDDAAVEAVVSDMQADAAKLTAADPNTPTTSPPSS